MKSPFSQRPDHLAREATEEFIAEHARTPDGGREGHGGGARAPPIVGLRRRADAGREMVRPRDTMPASALIGREEELGEIQACMTACADGPAGAGAGRRAGDRQDACCGRPGSRRPGSAATACSCTAASRPRRASRSPGCRTSSRRCSRRSPASSPRRGAGRWRWRCCSPMRATAPPRAAGDRAGAARRAAGARRDAPVLVALDDLQWLDAVVRSRCSRPRCGGWSASASGCSRPSAGHRPRALLGGPRVCASGRSAPLGHLGAARSCCATGSALELARPQLARLHEISGGNPFFALELARATAPTAASREPARSARRAHRRSAAHDASTCCCWPPRSPGRPRRIGRAARRRRATARALGGRGRRDPRSRTAGCASRIRCSPRCATTARRRRARRDAHRRLAAVVADVEERARHLALATTEPDAAVAAALDAAAAHAAARGAAVAAAELAELAADAHAAGRTPRTGDAARLAAARCCGSPATSNARRQIHDELLATTPPGVRARRPAVRRWRSAGAHMAERAALCEQGVAEAGRGRRACRSGCSARPRIYAGSRARSGSGWRALAMRSRRAERLGDPLLTVDRPGRAWRTSRRARSTSRQACSRRP